METDTSVNLTDNIHNIDDPIEMTTDNSTTMPSSVYDLLNRNLPEICPEDIVRMALDKAFTEANTSLLRDSVSNANNVTLPKTTAPANTHTPSTSNSNSGSKTSQKPEISTPKRF